MLIMINSYMKYNKHHAHHNQQLHEIQQTSSSMILQLERFCADHKTQKCIFHLQREVITI